MKEVRCYDGSQVLDKDVLGALEHVYTAKLEPISGVLELRGKVGRQNFWFDGWVSRDELERSGYLPDGAHVIYGHGWENEDQTHVWYSCIVPKGTFDVR